MSVEILSNRAYGKNGARKIHVSFTDAVSKKHQQNYIVDASIDVDAFLVDKDARLQITLITQEVNAYIADIESGKNPFRDQNNTAIDPIYSDRNMMIAAVLTHFLSLTDPVGLISAQPLLTTLSDAELMALLSIDETKVSEIRASANDVSNLSNSISSYVAPLSNNS